MSTPYTVVLEQVQSWPARDRLNLAQALLASLRPELLGPDPARPRRKQPLAELVGLLKSDSPPPSDEGCSRLLEDELLQKYGRS